MTKNINVLDKLKQDYCKECAGGDEYHCTKLKSDGYCTLHVYSKAIEDARLEIENLDNGFTFINNKRTLVRLIEDTNISGKGEKNG